MLRLVLQLQLIVLLVILSSGAYTGGKQDTVWLQRLFRQSNGTQWSAGCATGWTLSDGADACVDGWGSGGHVSCNADGRVYQLSLNSCNISGTLPEVENGAMSQLQNAFLSMNQLSGSLPESFQSLSSLQFLIAQSNQLNGTIPSSFGRLSSLQQMLLSNNRLIGWLPSSFFNLSKVQYLYVDNNQLMGTLPSRWVTGLRSLLNGFLWISNNCLNVTVPASDVSWWGNKSATGASSYLLQRSGGCPIVPEVHPKNTPSMTRRGSTRSVSSSSSLLPTASSSSSATITSREVMSVSRSVSGDASATSSTTSSGSPTSSSTTTSTTSSSTTWSFLPSNSFTSFTPSGSIPVVGLQRKKSSTSSGSVSTFAHLPSHSHTTFREQSITHSDLCDRSRTSSCQLQSWGIGANTTATVAVSQPGGALRLASYGELSERWIATASIPASEVRALFQNNGNAVVIRILIHCSSSSLSSTGGGSLELNGATSTATASIDAPSASSAATNATSSVAVMLVVSDGAALLQRVTQGSSTFWFRSGLQLVIAFDMLEYMEACDNASMSTRRVSIAVPITPDSVPASTATVAVIAAVQWTAGIASGASTVVSIGRMAANRRLLLCSDGSGTALSGSGGLLGIGIGSSTSPECDWVPLARGAIFGNAMVVIGSGILLCLLGCVWAFSAATARVHEQVVVRGWIRWFPKRMVRRMCLPSTLMGIWVAAATSTSAASASLWFMVSAPSASAAASCVTATGGRTASLIGWACFGVACVAIPLIPLCRVACGPEVLFGLFLQRRVPLQATQKRTAVLQVWNSIVRRRWVWETKPLSPHPVAEIAAVSGNACLQPHPPPVMDAHISQASHRMASALLLEYRVVWYALVDTVAMLLLSSVSGISGFLSGTACHGLAACVVSVLVVQLLVCVAVQPFTTIFAYVYNVITLLLALVSTSLQLYAISRLQASDTDNVLRVAVLGSAVCDLMSASLGLCKLLIGDLPAAIKGTKRLFSEMIDGLRRRRQGGVASLVPHVVADHDEAVYDADGNILAGSTLLMLRDVEGINGDGSKPMHDGDDDDDDDELRTFEAVSKEEYTVLEAEEDGVTADFTKTSDGLVFAVPQD